MSDDPSPAADVLIVGAGTSGCVLAARLSDDPARRVVLVEAGPPGRDAAMSGLDYLRRADPSRFWSGAAVERVDGQVPRPYASGRGFGGSAAVNGMVAMPPGADDLTAWAAAGCPDWTWAAVAPTVDALAPGWAPTARGDLGVLERALDAASAEASLGSFSAVSLERVDGRRASVADRILAPVLGRANLTMRSGAEVRRVLLDASRVVGVELTGGPIIEAGEVVLAAGAIRSPLLLAASGLIDAATSGRLSDHPSGTLTLRLRDGVVDSPLQTAGVVRWRTPSGAVAEALPIARVGDGLAAIAVAVMDPVSTGSIGFDASGSPRVRLGMLGEERDRAAMREVIAGTLALLGTAPMTALYDEVLAGSLGIPAADLLDAGDPELDAWVASTGSYLHAACSCPMGTVLDQWGRVRGVEGLRVVDASGLPVLPTVAPNATVTVGAAFIAANWSRV